MQTRQSLRLKGYDYSQSGAYFVTICAYRHSKLFGTIENGEMIPNAIGGIIDEEWQRTAELRPYVGLGAIVGRFKGSVSRRVHAMSTYCNLLVWQRNYYEHIIRNEGALQRLREYIAMNPSRWTEDAYYINNRIRAFAGLNSQERAFQRYAPTAYQPVDGKEE